MPQQDKTAKTNHVAVFGCYDLPALSCATLVMHRYNTELNTQNTCAASYDITCTLLVSLLSIIQTWMFGV